MSTKKILLIIFGGGFFLLLLFCLMLYLTLRTKVDDISTKEPFVSIINKRVILGNDAILVNNYEHFVYEEPLYLDAVGSQLYDGTTIAHYLKRGDVVVIDSFKDFTNGTSGFTHTIMFGNVTTGDPAKSIPFEYSLETQQIEKNANGDLVFTFELSPWEKEQ